MPKASSNDHYSDEPIVARSSHRRWHSAKRSSGRREEIISGARRCFRQAGFHGASMASIALEAGLSVGQIYRYFASKDDLIQAVARTEVDLVFSVLEVTLEPKMAREDLARNIEAGLRHLAKLAAQGLFHETSAEATRNSGLALDINAAVSSGRARLGLQLRTLMSFQHDDEIEMRLDAMCLVLEGYHSQLGRGFMTRPKAIATILTGLILGAR